MNYITAAEAAEKWGLTVRMVRIYCSKGRIQGAELHEDGWFVPEDAEKPARRKRESKPVKEDKAPYLANKLQKEKTKKRKKGKKKKKRKKREEKRTRVQCRVQGRHALHRIIAGSGKAAQEMR